MQLRYSTATIGGSLNYVTGGNKVPLAKKNYIRNHGDPSSSSGRGLGEPSESNYILARASWGLPRPVIERDQEDSYMDHGRIG